MDKLKREKSKLDLFCLLEFVVCGLFQLADKAKTVREQLARQRKARQGGALQRLAHPTRTAALYMC